MSVIDFGNYHRDVVCKAVCGVVGHNGAFMLRISLFESLYFVLFHVDRAENEVDH